MIGSLLALALASVGTGEARALAPVHPGLSFELGLLSAPTAKQCKLTPSGQAEICYAIPGGGGQALGLRPGDVIQSVNGLPVGSIDKVRRALGSLKPGDEVKLIVERGKGTAELSGRFGTRLSPEAELDRLRREADGGDAAALNFLGERLRDAGQPDDSARCFYRAAEAGLNRAQVNLGRYYLNLPGKKWENYERAAELFQKAADADDAEAFLSLGNCFFNAQGRPRDYAKAFVCYKRSAAGGCPRGQRYLAECYRDGYGVGVNRSEAELWFRKYCDRTGELIGPFLNWSSPGHRHFIPTYSHPQYPSEGSSPKPPQDPWPTWRFPDPRHRGAGT